MRDLARTPFISFEARRTFRSRSIRLIAGIRSPEADALGQNDPALSCIRQIDYTVVYARDLDAMRHFYEAVMGFPLTRRLSDRWFEYQIGSTLLALTTHGGRFDDPPPAAGTLSVQLAFRVPPAMVAACAEELEAKNVTLVSRLTDHPFGHRTIFFRDPDGNVLEIYAEI